MEKIINLLELAKLKQDLDKKGIIDVNAIADFARKTPSPKEPGFFECVFSADANKEKDEYETNLLKYRNVARFASLPNNLEVSPEIALFLYKNNNDLKQKLIEHDKTVSSNDLFKLMFALPSGLALTLLTGETSHTIKAGAKTAESFTKLYNYQKALSKIVDEGNPITEAILKDYKLTENESGKYLLQLQEIIIRSREVSNGRWYETVKWEEALDAGIDPDLNANRLPTLPSASKGRVK